VAVDLGDRQALDVVAPRREEADHTRKNAGLVVDDARQGSLFDAFIVLRHVIGGGRILADAALRQAAGTAASGWWRAAHVFLPQNPGFRCCAGAAAAAASAGGGAFFRRNCSPM